MVKDKLVSDIKEAIKFLIEHKNESYTYHWYLDRNINGNDWAIVLGWSDGFEEEPDNEFRDGTWNICMKVAFQPSNSMLQCDYGIDWLMYWDKETDEVLDCELSIGGFNIETDVEWLLDYYESIKEMI